ncbi:MAG TPA: MoaD/ThiS family protein [Jiangellales bacterium]|nr:MoaD/ThiS family protein [Jiangellales bacterium]
MSVLVRYWASAREAAGTAEERVDGSTLADVLDAVRHRHADRERFAEVLGVCSVLVDGEPAGGRDPAAVAVAEGSEVDLLPPFAGG